MGTVRERICQKHMIIFFFREEEDEEKKQEEPPNPTTRNVNIFYCLVLLLKMYQIFGVL